MAVYYPAGSWERAANTCYIIKAEENDGYTSYVIEVHIPPFKWHVSRRYRQFVELHEKVVKSFSLDKSLLPPKKVFGNKSESFIHERRKALELYLQTIIYQFGLLPEPVTKFLNFQKYEIRGITAALAETFFCRGDLIISKLKFYEFSPVQLHAITERLKLTEPTCYSNNPKQDIAHLVEFIIQLQHLKIIGSNEYFKDSNIIPNTLSYDLSLFKYLDMLEINRCKLDGNLISIDVLRKRLKSVVVYESLKDISTFLLCGDLHWSPNSSPSQNWPVWQYVTYVNFSHNSLTRIDQSIRLLPSVTHLDLSYNEIMVIENLETLTNLSSLHLSYNKIENLEALHTKLGNIYALHLSSNIIKTLQGFSKLFSVKNLYLDGNLISSLEQISHLSKLPCIELLNLKNNPITLNVDYRSQVLLIFGSHASEIELDGLKATEKEIDTVLVLQALKQARDDSKPSPTSDAHMEAYSEVKSNCNKDLYATSNLDNSSYSEREKLSTQVNNLCEASKFRQHIEALRKIGGSDWLRLLNEMNPFSEGSSEIISERGFLNHQESLDLKSISPFDEDFSHLSSHHIRTLAVSSEISFPECISLLDNTNEVFKHQFISALIKNKAYSDNKNKNIKEIQEIYFSVLPEAKLVWIVLLVSQKRSVYEIPICVVLFKMEIILLKIRNFSKTIFSDSCFDASLFPDVSFLRCISPGDILSITLGPCRAYCVVKVKTMNGCESLIFLFSNMDMADLFIEYCSKFYNITLSYMPHPFTNNIINFKNIQARSALSNEILFSQRVFVSKVFHKCHYGILHYVFITPTHIILLEERLHFPQVVQPQFHICTLVSVHTNIKQIHLKDIDDEMDISHMKPDSQVENKHVQVLYKCGSWLIIEFESDVLLCLKFFSLKQRNAFLDAFLSARSQR